jgi:hypothetical protein
VCGLEFRVLICDPVHTDSNQLMHFVGPGKTRRWKAHCVFDGRTAGPGEGCAGWNGEGPRVDGKLPAALTTVQRHRLITLRILSKKKFRCEALHRRSPDLVRRWLSCIWEPSRIYSEKWEGSPAPAELAGLLSAPRSSAGLGRAH